MNWRLLSALHAINHLATANRFTLGATQCNRALLSHIDGCLPLQRDGVETTGVSTWELRSFELAHMLTRSC
jgi:hypothetical protein